MQQARARGPVIGWSAVLLAACSAESGPAPSTGAAAPTARASSDVHSPDAGGDSSTPLDTPPTLTAPVNADAGRPVSCAPAAALGVDGTCEPCVEDSTCVPTAPACDVGTFDTGLGAAVACLPWTACAPGTFIASPGTASQDRVCQACSEGTFTGTLNAEGCEPWAECKPGAYVSIEPSSVNQRACTPCPDGQYTAVPNSANCVAHGECAAGTYAAQQATDIGAAECAACPAGSVCPGGSSAPQMCASGTWDGGNPAGSCRPHTACLPGSYIAALGAPSVDTVCSACPAGTFAAEQNAFECEPCVAGTYCPPGATAPGDCSTSSGFDQDNDATTACQAWTTCDDGFVEDTPGTALADRTCTPGYPFRLGSVATLSFTGLYAAHGCAQSKFGGSSQSGICVTVTTTRVEELVSRSSLGIIGDNSSDKPSISGDGRYVAFESAATNLVENDTNQRADIFVHDRTMATTRRVSVDSTGTQGDAESSDPSISDDGRYVVFESWAKNLVAGDTNDQPDVFLHDLQTGETTRVCERGKAPKLTADGAYVTVGEWPQGNGNSPQVALFERETGAVTLIGPGRRPTVSASGLFVAFESDAINLVAEDHNGDLDVFLRDVLAGTTRTLLVDANGETVAGGSSRPSISGDGRYVVFSTGAAVVPEDTNNQLDVYVYDATTGAIRRVGLDVGGKQLSSGSSGGTISGDGKFVAYGAYINRID